MPDGVPTSDSHAPCVACAGPTRELGTRGDYLYVSCRRCGTAQLDPMPTADELAHAYEHDYATSGHYDGSPTAVARLAAPLYRAVGDLVQTTPRPAGTVLDVGCGWGGFLSVLRDAGVPAEGVDFPSATLAHCISLGHTVREITRLGEALERRYAALTLITVFEHLADHRATLRELAGWLVPGGIMVILTPTSSVFSRVAAAVRTVRGGREIPAVNTTFCPPWHTVIPSVAGARLMIADAGLEVCDVRPSPCTVGTGVVRVAQVGAELVARAGFAVLGERWPLVLNHIIVCRVPEPVEGAGRVGDSARMHT